MFQSLSFESSSDDKELILLSDRVSEEIDHNERVECHELYMETHSKSDWFQCVSCKRWLHDTCSLYPDLCSVCGRMARKKTKINANEQTN